jgi:malate dehydrogenase (oxaloacetate-decarboxylating)(NADP+)
VTETEDLQLSRVMMQLGHKNTDLERYIYLINLLDHNETLFYRTVMSDPARFLPIVYDPTIGEACLKFGHIYRQARGMYSGTAASILYALMFATCGLVPTCFCCLRG